MASKKIQLPDVNLSEHGGVRYLHFGTPWVQGSMEIARPFDIELEYAQRMMGWLLFVDPLSEAHLKTMHSMHFGLGASTLTKFCYKKLQMKTTAIELNPKVVAACKLWFKLPNDNERLSVILGDAGEVASHEHWAHQIDALHVDLYDEHAQAPVIDAVDFYKGCRSLLSDQGAMVVNLFGKSVKFDQSYARIVDAFGANAVCAFRPTKEGNTVVIAQRNPVPIDKETLSKRAELIEQIWHLPAKKWLKVLALP
jgi:spermidine synthase